MNGWVLLHLVAMVLNLVIYSKEKSPINMVVAGLSGLCAALSWRE